MTSRDIDIIIATYNRPEKIRNLALKLSAIIEENVKIIIVDSSDEKDQDLPRISGVLYLNSSHKNQPYQRYLGFLASKAEILIYLDDDMEIAESGFIKIINELFENDDVSGVAIKFRDKAKATSISMMPSSRFLPKNNHIKDIKGWLTGYPNLSDGEFGYCGNRGIQPKGGGMTEWVSGGAFAARRSAMFQNFNFQLLDIFEEHLGMGEDGIIGYGLSKMGNLIYHDELLFLHNDQKDSTYVTDIQGFAKRVAFSRLFLSLERNRLNHESKLLAIIHYHYFIFWRLLGFIMNFVINPGKPLWDIITGTCKGWAKAAKFRFSRGDTVENYWHSEALNDLYFYKKNASI